MKPLRIGIVGAGAWAMGYHLPVLRRLADRGEVRITGVWSRTRTHAESAARSGGIDRVYDRMDDLLDEVDCVSVVVSKHVVADLIELIAARGVAFITEKPPGENFDQIDRLATEVAVPHVVGFNRRYQPVSQAAKELIADMAPVRYVECAMTRAERDDSHFVTETGIHCLDLLEYWFGPISDVDAVQWRDGDSPAWTARLSFESGVKGAAKFFPFGGASTEHYEMYTDHESFVVRTRQHHVPDESNEIVLSGSRRSRHPGTTMVSVGDSGDALVDQGFLGEYEDLLRSVRTGGTHTTRSNLDTCRNIIRVAELIEKPRR